MLLTKTVIQKWNAKIKKHYVDLGYNYTKMNDCFECKVEDLTSGSAIDVEFICDYCGNKCTKKYFWYIKSRKYVQKDCCDNPECTTKKAKEVVKAKYNVDNIRQLEWVNEKISNTNIEKYGCENPFGNEDVKSKIKETNLIRYGVERPSCNEKIKEKIIEGNKKFCSAHEKPKGENHPNWKPELTLEYRIKHRCTTEYNDWRKAVYERDDYTCQCCGMKRTKHTQPPLNAHHIENYAQHPDKQTDIDNGITLCEPCHEGFHKKYGKKDNNLQQLEEFIKFINENN